MVVDAPMDHAGTDSMALVVDASWGDIFQIGVGSTGDFRRGWYDGYARLSGHQPFVD